MITQERKQIIIFFSVLIIVVCIILVKVVMKNNSQLREPFNNREYGLKGGTFFPPDQRDLFFRYNETKERLEIKKSKMKSKTVTYEQFKFGQPVLATQGVIRSVETYDTNGNQTQIYQYYPGNSYNVSRSYYDDKLELKEFKTYYYESGRLSLQDRIEYKYRNNHSYSSKYFESGILKSIENFTYDNKNRFVSDITYSPDSKITNLRLVKYSINEYETLSYDAASNDTTIEKIFFDKLGRIKKDVSTDKYGTKLMTYTYGDKSYEVESKEGKDWKITERYIYGNKGNMIEKITISFRKYYGMGVKHVKVYQYVTKDYYIYNGQGQLIKETTKEYNNFPTGEFKLTSDRVNSTYQYSKEGHLVSVTDYSDDTPNQPENLTKYKYEFYR